MEWLSAWRAQATMVTSTRLWRCLAMHLLWLTLSTDSEGLPKVAMLSSTGGHQASAFRRRLEMEEFTGWALTKPPGSNLLSYQQERIQLVSIAAGAIYPRLTLFASNSLGINASLVRLKLVRASASKDVDCLPGSPYEVHDIVVPSMPVATPLDGRTPAQSPAANYENSWVNVRFPRAGEFETCYLDGAGAGNWRHIPAKFAVQGSYSNAQVFWCVASQGIQCQLMIIGLGVKTSWLLTTVDYGNQYSSGTCGVSNLGNDFVHNRSIASAVASNQSRMIHTLGPKQDVASKTYKVCYCTGYNHDSIGNVCTASDDFVQLAGVLYTTKATPKRTPYPLLTFDLRLECGSSGAGGCPMSSSMRLKIVDHASNNNLPSFDSSSGCRSAPEAANYFLPLNCGGVTSCTLEPTLVSTDAPEWSGISMLPSFSNVAQVPQRYDVCFCAGACSLPQNWFKFDSIDINLIEVLPNPTIANRPTNFILHGASGGWTQTGERHYRELKFLYDPVGSYSSEDCFTRDQDLQVVTGHYCLERTDCKQPTTSTADGHTWNDIRIHNAGMYAVCYCDRQCHDKSFWSLLKWHLVAGPASTHSWEFSRGLAFDMNVSGYGLQTSNRILVITEDSTCGDSKLVVASGFSMLTPAPQQRAETSGYGIQSLSYVFDGISVNCLFAHGLTAQEDSVELFGITSGCSACAALLAGRPHKVIRVPTATQFVIQVFYSEQTFPQFTTTGGTWVRSSRQLFQGILASASGRYRVCWSSSPSSNPLDFAASAGLLTIVEPPIFEAKAYLTALESGATAPLIVAFNTRQHPRYSEKLGETQLRFRFPHLNLLSPSGPVAGSAVEVLRNDARQSTCGRIVKEVWSSDPDGFPMPKGCFYISDLPGTGGALREYGIVFTARNGLKGGTSYQIVFDAIGRVASSEQASKPNDGLVQLWSMDDVSVKLFGVIEHATAWLHENVRSGARGAEPQLHAVNGAMIIAQDPVLELPRVGTSEIALKLQAAAGAPLVQGSVLRIFLWPLTQWNIEEACTVSCLPHNKIVLGNLQPMECQAPVCKTDSVVLQGESGSNRNSLHLTFSRMDPITDSVRHTVVLSQLRLPTGGFFATAFGVEVRSGAMTNPSYQVTSGSLVYLSPTAVGSVVSGSSEGEDKPFRGDRNNKLFIRIVLGASIWGDSTATASGTGSASESIVSATGLELILPSGYSCIRVAPAGPDELMNFFTSRGTVAPQGRGEVALDAIQDGYWLYSGQTCIYVLRPYTVAYAGSAIVLRLSVNNPIFALKQSDIRNTWSVRLRGRSAPLAGESSAVPTLKISGLSAFSDLEGDKFLRRNSAVLGILTGTSLTPSLFGVGQDRNWLSVFFTAEQSCPGNGAKLLLLVPPGFGFSPLCSARPLPSHHYASMSSQRAGLTLPTRELRIARCIASIPYSLSQSQAQSTSSQLPNLATITVPNTARIEGGSTYGFQIQVFNTQEYQQSQHNNFRITTSSVAGDHIDSSYYTVRFLASEGEGPGTSFGVYKLPMRSGTFVLSIENMLPYRETGLRSRVVLFPLKVPFDSLDAVDWRLIAPYGYEWDFLEDEFFFQRLDILGATADLPIARKPIPPTLPPKNVLSFEGNFQGSWDRRQTYGMILRVRVPEATPRSSTNAFFVEFGFTSTVLENGRLAAASFEAPKVRALVNCEVEYLVTSLAGKQNRLKVKLELNTGLPKGGGMTLESPPGFVFERNCAVLASPALRAPYKDLSSIDAKLLCGSSVPYTTDRPLVTISVLTGAVAAAPYEFAIDVQNPMTPSEATEMTWIISSFTNVGLEDLADLAATVQGFAVESPMQSGKLLGRTDGVNFASTRRDDHPGQLSNVIVSFSLTTTPVEVQNSVLTVKAPPGFSFLELCKVVVAEDTGLQDDSVFGSGNAFPNDYRPFESTAVVSSCKGMDSRAQLLVGPGLRAGGQYAFRIEVQNPEATPEQNRWSISYAGQSTEPFDGYRLWRLTEFQVAASHTARSTAVEDTKNHVSIRFRPTNSLTAQGFLLVEAPFGFRIPTVCTAVVERLDALGNFAETLPAVECKGSPTPSNSAEIHLTGSAVMHALELHRLDVLVLNPLTIPTAPGSWKLQTYATKQSEYSSLLDFGDGVSFQLREVFHTLLVTYPTITGSLVDELQLRMQIALPNAIEIGDVLRITGPEGYDFRAEQDNTPEFGACKAYSLSQPATLTTPQCQGSQIQFTFATTGLALVQDPAAQRLTPLIDFKVSSIYPRRTLSLVGTVFFGEHQRGQQLLASKTVQGQIVTPRLQSLSVTRLDSTMAVEMRSSLRVAFTPSQPASALLITTGGGSQTESEANQLYFLLEEAKVVATENGDSMQVQVAWQQGPSLMLQMALMQVRSYMVSLSNVVNPKSPGTAMWTLTTYAQVPDAEDVAAGRHELDSSKNLVGPMTVIRIQLDPTESFLGDAFFDVVSTELKVTFSCNPRAVASGSFLVFYAPIGYAFVDKSFSPGEGFPLISGQVFALNDAQARPRYVVHILTQILAAQTVKFTTRVRTPSTPSDLAVWTTTHQRSWKMLACSDPDCGTVSASNDDVFPGFTLKGSFGDAAIIPEANGVAPQIRVTVTLSLNPKASLSTQIAGGSVSVRLVAPLGFDFPEGCLAVSPNPTFQACFGFGRKAVLPANGGRVRAGAQSAALSVTNAAMTPSADAAGAGNTWLMESFVDLTVAEVVDAQSDLARQRSHVAGYEIRELLKASIGANTQLGAVTTVFVWFISTNFLDVGGAVELHAPPTYELRCNPRVQYISLPAGACRLLKGVTSTSGDLYHHYLSLDLTLPGQQVYPNTAYEFGAPAVNPSSTASPNYWGLVLRKRSGDVVDATRTIDGYKLTNYQLFVQTPLASSTYPGVVNMVRLTLTFQRLLPPGEIGHISILAPSTSKVICQYVTDLSGGGSTAAQLPLSSVIGVYGTHSCKLQNSVTLHVDPSRAVQPGSYLLELRILNPGLRAARDYWVVELLPTGPSASAGNSSNTSVDVKTFWRTAEALLRVSVSGFGVSSAFATEILPIASAAWFKASSGCLALWSVFIFVAL